MDRPLTVEELLEWLALTEKDELTPEEQDRWLELTGPTVIEGLKRRYEKIHMS